MKTKILVIGPLPPPTGGMETVMEQMKNLKFEDYKLIPFNVSKNKIIKSNIVFNTTNFIYRCIKLILILLFRNPKIVHIHTSSYMSFWQNAYYLKISKMFGKKVILHMHGGAFEEFYKESDKMAIDNTLKSANGLIVLTKSWEKFYEKIRANTNIQVIPNAIDLELIKKYCKYKQESKTTKLLFVGRIEQKKGIYELLESMKLLKKENIHLAIMGSFMDNEKEIRALCDKYDITSKVTFLGVVKGDDRFKHYTNSDIFVLPSYWEGLPMTILEAMASGMPVIATNVGGIPELVKKENGILVEPKDSKQLSKAILKIVRNKNIASNMKKNNLQKVKKFSIEKFQEDLKRTYYNIK